MWGDKNNDTFFEYWVDDNMHSYFCDQKTMQIYLDLVKTGQREVVVAVIKSITMLL
jgi:protein CLEC16A